MRVSIDLETDGHEYSVTLEADQRTTPRQLVTEAAATLDRMLTHSSEEEQRAEVARVLRETKASSNSAIAYPAPVAPDAPQYQRRVHDNPQA